MLGYEELWRNSKSELYRYVERIRYKYGAYMPRHPIDLVALLSQFDDIVIEFHDFKSPMFCAMAFLGYKTDTILLNSARGPSATNFDCGHELMHINLHRHIGLEQFACSSILSRSKMQDAFVEWEANEGAAEFLVPYLLLLPRIRDNQYNWSRPGKYAKFLEDLTNEFIVTETIIKYRIESLKYEIFQYLNGVDIDDIQFLSDRQQKAKGVVVSSLNDIYGKRSPRNAGYS